MEGMKTLPRAGDRICGYTVRDVRCSGGHLSISFEEECPDGATTVSLVIEEEFYRRHPEVRTMSVGWRIPEKFILITRSH